ncbi:hypothetical protein FHP29_05980 [Nocardioides albidus]|uniref:Matrixin family metalloprotease n=1 Tax=Nocardioides albidus TaxID=1517589 RepID=A0A5C4W6W1_9ACTN|nr:hypothetical protein [Nocardioides albidus]TNM43245.1 hypothetical protein FHP29_05980 [Nocardioides albidus]
MRLAARRTALVLVALVALLAPLLVSSPAEAGRRTRVVAVFSATQVALGTPVTVTGVVKDRGKRKRKVVLEQRIRGGWRTVSKGRTTRTGAFALPVDTSWLYTTRLRVRAPRAKGAGPDTSKATWVTVSPGYAPAGDPNAWSPITQGMRTRFNPCRSIRYQIRPGLYGAGFVSAVSAALADVTAATGLRFVDRGLTDLIPRNQGGPWPAKVDLILAATTVAESAATGSPLESTTGGRAGPHKTTWGRDPRGRVALVKSAHVWINSTPASPMTPNRLLQILKHEIAHAIGLGHTESPGQYMNTSTAAFASLPLRGWGAGDLTGLARQGLQGGCVRRLR